MFAHLPTRSRRSQPLSYWGLLLVNWPVKVKFAGWMLPQGVELSCANITSAPKWRMCLPRTRVSVSEGMKVFSIKTAFVPVLRILPDWGSRFHSSLS